MRENIPELICFAQSVFVSKYQKMVTKCKQCNSAVMKGNKVTVLTVTICILSGLVFL